MKDPTIILPYQSTFSEDNYLPITFFLDGSYEQEEVFDYDEYMKNVEEDIARVTKVLEEDPGNEAHEQFLDTLLQSQKLMKMIWETDIKELDNEDYEE